MIKRLLCLLLATVLILCLCACSAEGEEIAKSDFDLNSNKVLADGFSDFTERLDGIYDDPQDWVELGGQNIIPVVDFDDTVCLSIDGFDYYTRYFYYLMVELKSSDISNALLYGINAKDDDSFWNSCGIDTFKTRRELIIEKAKKYAYYVTISNAIMDDYGFVQSDSYALSYENILSLYGNEQAVEDYYGAYGLGDKKLLPYLKMYSAYSEFREFLVGVDGKLYPTDEEAKEFFKDECLYFEQIVFNYVYTNDDGYTYKKTDAEITDARSRGEAVYSQILKDPRMYDRNMHLTEHAEWSENVHGYTYIPNEILPELEEAYFKLKPGEVTAVDTSLGYYIIRALEKTDRAFKDSNSRIIDAYCDKAFNAIMAKNLDKLVVNETELDRYAFKDVLVFEK